MDWVYERPVRYSSILIYLEKRLKHKSAAERILKVLSLYSFLRKHSFKSPRDIQTRIFYDLQKRKPVFSASQAERIFRLLKQKGGTSDEAVMIDKGIRVLINYIRDFLPAIVLNVSDLAYPYVTLFRTLQENPEFGPFVQLAKEIAVETGTTAIVTADTVASDIGGPIGSLAVALPSAIAGAMVVVTHISEDELGEALLASFLILPFVGPILYKTATSVGKVAHKVATRRDDIIGTTRMFLGDEIGNTVDMYIPSLGGKRFSTQKRKDTKWLRKTQRRKFV